MEKKDKRPKNKILIISSVIVMIVGIFLGIILIFINLNQYFNNISKYTEQDKISLEKSIKENDEKYNQYLSEIDALNTKKEQYQIKLSKEKDSSSNYIILQDKINSINKELETLDSNKYSVLSEKNNLQKEYNAVIEALAKKENSYYLVSCYFLGFIVIISAIVLGIVLLQKGYKPDYDEVILENQKKIDAIQQEKLEQLKKERAAKRQTKKVETPKETSSSKKEPSIENLPKLKESKKVS